MSEHTRLRGQPHGLPLLTVYAIAAYLCLYLPIFLLVLFSFNNSKFSVNWTGFTLKWYGDLFADKAIWAATRNTLIVGLTSTLVSTLIGTAAALALHRYDFRGKGFSEAALYLAIMIPEVVLGIALLAFFAQTGFSLGLPTIITGHIVFSLPFVALTVRARLPGMNRSLEEAAMDLGANEVVTFWRVTLPLIMPGVLSGALLAFTLSLGDCVITMFTAGPGSTTLPLRVFSMLKTVVTPKVNALSTLWILTVFVVLLVSQRLQARKA